MANGNQVTFGPFRLDVPSGCLWREGQAQKMTLKAFAVLCCLVERVGRVVTKEEVFRVVWPDTVVSEAALTVCIRELRQALGDDAKSPRYIETVHRRGYRFIAKGVSSQPSVLSGKEEARDWRRETGPTSPQASSLQSQVSSLVGRDAELHQLHIWLEKALNGERQIVFVTGEAGIGKTALGEAFLFGVRSREKFGVQSPLSPTPNPELPLTPVPWFAWGQCIEQFGAGEAYLPVLSALGQLGREAGQEQLVAVLRQYAPTWLMQLPAFVPPSEVDLLLRKTAGATRERMLREIAEALEVLTAEQPLVLVLEDLHWSDPSTLELLSFVARRRQAAKLLIIGTYRPVEVLSNGHPLRAVVQELQLHRHCEELPLRLLTEMEVATYLGQRLAVEAPGHAPRQEFSRLIHQRTEGNPLFMVTVVDDLLARNAIDGQEVEVSTPPTIRQMIERQYEHLSSAEQQVLAVASVAGAEFSAAAVAAGIGVEGAEVERQGAGLVRRGQFLRRRGVETWPDGTVAERYTFLHALYQEVIYERIPVSQRVQWHRRIGEREEQAYGERAREVAAELAVHFERGREYRRAVQYHCVAGQQALQRSASQEAIAHLTTGLALLTELSVTPERDQHELLLQMSLGAALMPIKGYGAPEVEAAYRRAWELCHQLGNPHQLFPMLYGLLLFYSMRGDLKIALELDRQFQSLAQHHQDPIPLVNAHYASGLLSFLQGKFSSAQTFWERCLSLYDPHQAPTHMLLYGYDPGVIADMLFAFMDGLRGYPEQAVRKAQAALTRARTLSHFHTQALTHFWAAHLYQVRREGQVVQAYGEVVISLTQEQGSANGLAHGLIMQGWALVEQGQVEEGIIRIHEGLTGARAGGVKGGTPCFLALLAEAYGKGRQAKKGLQMLAEALAVANENGEYYYEAELYRLKGVLTLEARDWKRETSPLSLQASSLKPQISQVVAQEAEGYFLKAIEIARHQQAKMWELRATMSLARLWQQQGKTAEAHQMLSAIYHWFTEGFDTKDLQEAKALLEVLRDCGVDSGRDC